MIAGRYFIFSLWQTSWPFLREIKISESECTAISGTSHSITEQSDNITDDSKLKLLTKTTQNLSY